MSTTILRVQGHNITVDKDEYICLTDMAKADGDGSRAADLIKNWINTKATLEFLATWESINNSIFKVVEFHHFKEHFSNGGVVSVNQWVEKTDAIGIYSKLGKYGGTYAHKDIAFEFGAAISPAFKLYLIKEYQRLKELENNAGNLQWNIRRVLCKAQYHVQTDAIKLYKIPNLKIPESKLSLAYAEEGDILNLALFGFTAKQWREAYVQLAARGENVRNYASINELAILSVLEGINAEMIKENIPFDQRLEKLKQVAREQLKTLNRVNVEYSLRKTLSGEFKPFFKQDEIGMFPVDNRQVS